MRRQRNRDRYFRPHRLKDLYRCSDISAHRLIRGEFKYIKNWSLEKLEMHEELVESRFAKLITRRTGRDLDQYIPFGRDDIDKFLLMHRGLHIDQAYRRLLSYGRNCREKDLLTDAFIKRVGQLRLKWDDKGARDFGGYTHFLGRELILFIDEHGVISMLDYDAWEKWEESQGRTIETASALPHVPSEPTQVPKRNKVRYPFWEKGRYHVSQDQWYAYQSVGVRICHQLCYGHLWYSYRRMEDITSDLPCAPQYGSLERVYGMRQWQSPEDGSLWLCAPATSEEAAYLYSLIEERRR